MIYRFVFVILFLLGLYVIMVDNNLIKKVIGINIMEAAVFLFAITLSDKGGIPIYSSKIAERSMSDPVPQALILTGIVIGASTTAYLLTLIIELKKLSGSIMLDEVEGLDD